MGQALYRKYRSKSLDEIVGQQHITDTLKQALDKGAISHAYLFTGPRGTGKTSIARIMAHEINNLPYDESATHLDIIEIDAASNRRIDEIRDLRDKVHIAPTSSKYKVYIIDEVHMLTREAFNALLKTLEEPPEHAVFILATTELHKVPDTIVSRTQKYTFRLYEPQEVIDHLKSISKKEKINITDDALGLLAEHGKGSFRDSISILDQIAGFSYDEISKEHVARLLGVPSSETIDSLLNAVAGADTNELFLATAKLRQDGSQSSKVAQQIINHLRVQLSESTLSMPANQAVDTMKLVLPLTGSNSSHEALEIALLDAANLTSPATVNTKPAPKSKPQEQKVAEVSTSTPAPVVEAPAPPKPVKEESPIEQPVSEPTPPEETTTEPVDKPTTEKVMEMPSTTDPPPAAEAPAAQPAGSSEEAWKQVLAAVKNDNGTLHGILRMADVAQEDDALSLKFQFAFHKNQISKAANMNAFMKHIEQAYGRKIEVTMGVKEAPNAATPAVSETQPEEKKEQEQQENSDLANISNIFGGSELLD